MPLGYALCARVAQHAGLRILAIKGPVLQAQGIRSDHLSIDVDVWVDPAAVMSFGAALVSLGWHVEAPSTTAQIVPMHSVPYRNGRWPCELDVHDRFPGFLADPQTVFEALWQQRSSVTLADVEVPCTDLVGSAAVAALHVLRDPRRRRQEAEALFGRLAHLMGPQQRRALGALAARTGAVETLSPLLEELGLSVQVLDLDRAALRAWRLRTSSSGMRSVAWAHEFSVTPLRRWPRLARRALLLTEPEIRVLYPDEASGWKGLWRGRARRLFRGVGSLPKALVHLLRHRD